MLNCIVLDDEPLALEVLKKYISKVYYLNLVGAYTDPTEAKQVLENQKIDLLFLDIQMPDINGIDFYKHLKNENLAVIFTTAYSEFAVEGFNLDAIDYLLKPFEYDRFLKGVLKAKEYLDYLANQEIQQGFIFLKSDYQLVKINFKDILYIEGLDDYVKVYLPQKSILTLMTLKNLAQKLPPKEFLRAHRSFIVPISKIDQVSKTKVTIGTKEIPIGASYSENFQSMVNHRLNRPT